MKSCINPALFCYAIPSTAFLANTTTTPAINFASDSDFQLIEIRATQQAIGALLMQLSVSSGEVLSNIPLDTRLFAEDNYPVRLPFPVLIPANTQLNVQIQNTTGGALTSQIQFWGIKIDKG